MINFRKILITSTCAISLSTTLSVFPSLSMEQCQERLASDIFRKEILSGREENYAYYYVTLIINKGIREETARQQAEIYEKLVTEGKCEFYEHKYAASIIS